MTKMTTFEKMKLELEKYKWKIVLDMFDPVILDNVSEDDDDYYYDYITRDKDQYSCSAVVWFLTFTDDFYDTANYNTLYENIFWINKQWELFTNIHLEQFEKDELCLSYNGDIYNINDVNNTDPFIYKINIQNLDWENIEIEMSKLIPLKNILISDDYKRLLHWFAINSRAKEFIIKRWDSYFSIKEITWKDEFELNIEFNDEFIKNENSEYLLTDILDYIKNIDYYINKNNNYKNPNITQIRIHNNNFQFKDDELKELIHKWYIIK